MIENFQNAVDLIHESQRILLTMHERMDADDGGAGLAMAHALSGMGKTITHAIKKGVPPILAFMPGSENIIDDISHTDFDLLITFGCATKDRTGSENILNLTCPVINIDHHPDNAFFGDINIVDKTKSSVAELVYDFFIYNNWPITRDMATCLLTGIVGDTGAFKHSNTQSSTLKAAAELMKKGALTDKIIREMFKNKSATVLKAWGKAMDNAHYDKERKIIYSIMTADDLGEIGDLPPATFEGFVETLNTAPDAKFAMFLRQDGNLIKGSLRSSEHVDVSKIAQLFGGGGHKQAAGFAIMGKLMKDEFGKWKVV